MSRNLLPLGVFFWGAVAFQVASAQTFDWINTSGGTYSTPGNWSPAGPPGTASTVRFALANTYTVSFTANATANTMSLNQGDITLSLGGKQFQLNNTTNNGVATAGATGTLRVNNGTFLPGNLSVGGGLASNGTLVLDSGSVTTVGGGVFFVGTSGTGKLMMNGGTLSTAGSTGLGLNADGVGTANVNGANSSWAVFGTLRIGSAGNGTVNVLNGGALTAFALEVGELLGSTGSLSVSGAGSSFTTNGTANVGGSFAANPAAAASLSVGPGGGVFLNGTTNLRTSATVNLTGGLLALDTLNVTPGAVVNWSAGKVEFTSASTVTGPVLDLFLAGTHTLGTNRTLAANGGSLNLDTNLAVNGGTINVPIIDVNASLTIGAFGTVAAGDAVNLGAGKSVQIENFGSLGATNFILNNGATLQLNGPSAQVTGFFANNAGLVQGTGRFAGGMNNGTGGTIRARAGDHIIIDGIGPTNPGNIELSGGTLEYSKTLSNLANGIISGRGEFRGSTSILGGIGLSNLGVMAFSGGTMDIHGDVLNTGGGKIVAAGGSVVTFYDDVTHNGAEIRTNSGSRTVFFGSQTGAGSFPGTGTVEYDGDLRPGNSPANIAYGGDVEFTSSARLEAEIGGTTFGSQYDRLTVDGQVALGSARLELHFINGFIPSLADSFTIIDVTSRSMIDGMFDGLSEGEIFTHDGVKLQASYVGGSGNDFTLTVVPEPTSLSLVASAGMLLCLRRRFKRSRH